MRRFTFNLAAAVSLVLFLVTPVVWVRSFRDLQFAHMRRGHWASSIVVAFGELRWCCVRYTFESSAAHIHVARDDKDTIETIVGFVGDPLVDFPQRRFEATSGEGMLPGVRVPSADGLFHPDFHYWSVTMPVWVVIGCAAILPVIYALRRLSKRSDGNRCERCNYDLRATPTRCPECGTPVTTVANG